MNIKTMNIKTMNIKTMNTRTKWKALQSGLWMAVLLSGFWGCIAGENPDLENLPYEQGYVIGNEGAFGSSNASIGFRSLTGGIYQADVVGAVNQGLITGDVLQSLFASDSLLFAVLNNSNRILLLDRYRMEYKGEIGNLALPRYLVQGQQALYLSEWVNFSGNGRVQKINSETAQLEGSVEVGALPEHLLAYQGKIYVPNSYENTVSVLTEVPFAKAADYIVGDYPQACLALNGSVWVLNGGKPDWTGAFSYGSWMKLDEQGQVVTEISLNQAQVNPNRVVASPDGRFAYFIFGGDVWFLDAYLETVGVLISGANAYGLGVDSRNGDVLVGESGDFSSASDVAIYNAQGQLQNRFKAGIAPSSFAVNP